MEKKLKLIHIEDSKVDARLTANFLKSKGLVFQSIVVETEKEFIKALESFDPDLIIADHSMPNFDSLRAFDIMCERRPLTPFILLTGSVSEEFAVECLLKGMDDYILKSNMIRLPLAIQRVLSRKQITVEKDAIEQLHRTLQDTYDELRLRNEEITDSINYAKRIQDAILPGDDVFYDAFPSAFILNRPRDIVSGDMYWLSSSLTTDGRKSAMTTLALIDCTGHGIPGAFMGLLSCVLLNETARLRDIQSPADVLRFLNKKLPWILNRNNKERISDGLDIAICSFVHNKRTMHYSGANRPLWVLRKNGREAELMEFNGARASIGWHTPADYTFEDHTIDLEKGDRLFLFTDGITDQFGGVNGKKLTSKRLKMVLLDSANLTFSDQQQYLRNLFTDWCCDQDQVDDQLFIGIEVE